MPVILAEITTWYAFRILTCNLWVLSYLTYLDNSFLKLRSRHFMHHVIFIAANKKNDTKRERCSRSICCELNSHMMNINGIKEFFKRLNPLMMIPYTWNINRNHPVTLKNCKREKSYKPKKVKEMILIQIVYCYRNKIKMKNARMKICPKWHLSDTVVHLTTSFLW